jgi:taurine dioxygenase
MATVQMTGERIKVTPIAGALGAEIDGVDLGRPLEAGTIAEIRQALLDHLVIFFRDQVISPERYMGFAAAFGTPVEYPMLPGIAGYPMITEIVKLEHETSNFGGLWHSDTTYLEQPPMGSILHALEVPPHGGDTMWANQYLAYETLSAPLRAFLDGLTAINVSTKPAVSKTREAMIAAAGSAKRAYVAEHPAIRTHPETGRRGLFVNCAHTLSFKGMTEAESQPILDFLFRHQVEPEFTCRFQWRKGSVAFWDNRSTQHNPINDYNGHRRVMRRITLQGDVPF